jgi:hypothetical protein
VITSVSSVHTPGNTSSATIGSFGVTPAPNNDNAAGTSPNGFTYNVFVNAVDFMEVEFNVANSGGTTEYNVTQSLLNLTQSPWTNYSFELGFGTGANFVRSGVLDLLDFDFGGNTTPTSNRFGTLSHQSDVIGWSNGSVGFINSVLFSFAIDVPDGLQNINPYGQSRFTLRQVAAAAAPDATPVPEPTSMVLLGSGLLGLVARVRKQRRG